MKKTYRFLLTVFLLSTIITASAFGQVASAGRVEDKAGLLSAQQEEALEGRISTLSVSLGLDIAIAVVESLDGKDIQSYADNYFESQNYGFGQNYDGGLLLLSIGDREWHITTSGRAMDFLTLRRIDAIGDAMTPYLSSGDYYQAFDVCLGRINSYALEPAAYDEDIGDNAALVYIAVIIASLIITLVTMLAMKSKMNTAKAQRSASNFSKPGSFKLIRQSDIYLWSSVSKTPKAPPPDTRSSSGAHTSSSGRSFGGGGGKF
jgi:uncharacterized protein